jgi:hypothetical protein
MSLRIRPFGILLLLATACGSDAHYLGGSLGGTGTGGSVSIGSEASSGSAGESGGSGSVTSSGTLAASGDPLSCIVSASNYDQSCAVDTDCTGINPGNYCGTQVCDCGGPTAAINVGALPQYTADLGGAHFMTCPCPFIPFDPAQGPCCRSGSCQVGVCAPDAGLASDDEEDASSDAESALRDTGAASVATLTAECFVAGSVYHSGMKSFSPEDFCDLFEATCLPMYEIPSEMALESPATCEATFASLPSVAQSCRTQHLCNAATGVAARNPHCYHVQGWASATTMQGGPCP